MRYATYLITALCFLTASATISENHDAFLFIVKYQGPDGSFAGTYGTMQEDNGFTITQNSSQTFPELISNEPKSSVSTVYHTENSGKTQTYETNRQECQPAFKALTTQQQAIHFESAKQAEQYYTLVTTQQQDRLDQALSYCQTSVDKLEATNTTLQSINTTYTQTAQLEPSKLEKKASPSSATATLPTALLNSSVNQKVYEKITGKQATPQTTSSATINQPYIPAPQFNESYFDYQSRPRLYEPTIPSVSLAQLEAATVVIYWAIQFLKNPKQFIEDVKKQWHKTIDFLKGIGQGLLDAFNWCKEKVKAFFNWLCWLFTSDAELEQRKQQAEQEVLNQYNQLQESYKKNILQSPEKLLAMKTVQSMAELLQACSSGTKEEQILAQIQLFQMQIPSHFFHSVKEGLDELAKKCFDKNGVFHASSICKKDLDKMFARFYSHVASAPLETYATSSNTQFSLQENLYKKKIDPLLYQAVLDLFDARLHADLFAMHNIKEQFANQPVMQELYYESINNVVKQANNGSIVPACAQRDPWYHQDEHAKSNGHTNDILLARNYIVEELWPYLGSDSAAILQPLYEVLPTDATIFNLIEQANYRITTTAKYAQNVVQNHKNLLTQNGILHQFAQHPFVMAQVADKTNLAKQILTYANFALIMSNMYQDHQTQELAHQLLYAAHQAYNTDHTTLAQTHLQQAQMLYELLQDNEYKPAFYEKRPVTPEVELAYDHEIPELVNALDTPRNQARLETIAQNYEQFPYSAELNTMERFSLEEQAISPWQFENIYATTLQAHLYDECHTNISTYVTQKNSELTATIDVLALRFTDIAAGYIRLEQFDQACHYLNASYAGLCYTGQVAAIYLQAVAQGIGDTVNDVADLSITIADIAIASWNHPQQAKENFIHAMSAVCNLAGSIAFDLADDPLTNIVKYSNALYDYGKEFANKAYEEYSSKSGPERVRAITHLITKEYLTFKSTTAFAKFAHHATSKGLQKVGIQAHTIFAAKQGQLGLALTGKNLSSPIYTFVQKLGNATVLAAYNKLASWQNKCKTAIDYYAQVCKKKFKNILHHDQQDKTELIPTDGTGVIFPEIVAQGAKEKFNLPAITNYKNTLPITQYQDQKHLSKVLNSISNIKQLEPIKIITKNFTDFSELSEPQKRYLELYAWFYENVYSDIKNYINATNIYAPLHNKLIPVDKNWPLFHSMLGDIPAKWNSKSQITGGHFNFCNYGSRIYEFTKINRNSENFTDGIRNFLGKNNNRLASNVTNVTEEPIELFKTIIDSLTNPQQTRIFQNNTNSTEITLFCQNNNNRCFAFIININNENNTVAQIKTFYEILDFEQPLHPKWILTK